MTDATILNNVEAKRIFKSNAQGQLCDAQTMLTFYRDRLMILAAMSPMNVDEGEGLMPWDLYIQRELDNIIDEICDESRREWMAQYIIDNPDDCEDPFKEKPCQ